jgi:predicted O-linked N-acetylglucosamine transferase (SPINDLY family)
MYSSTTAENLFHSALEDIKNKSYKKAEVKLREAHSKSPGRESIMLNLSSVLIQVKKFEEADKVLDGAIKIFPKNTDLLLNKSFLLITKQEIINAIELLIKIIKIDTKISSAYYKLASCYVKTGDNEEAIKNFEKSFNLSPDYISLSNIIFYLNFSKNYSDNKYINLLNKFRFFLPKLDKLKILDSNFKNKKKLNIGFVSADLRSGHPVGNGLHDFFINLKKYFNLISYYNASENQDTDDFKKLFSKWENIKELKDIDVIKLIKGQQIDILIDLSGHSSGNRLNIFAHKAAPVQITWCGYLNSTGIIEIDYIIGDPYVTPQENQSKYVEKIIQMPKIWSCFSIPKYLNINITNETPAIKNKYITFGSFNQISKLNDDVIQLWSKILKENLNTKLFLKNSNFQEPYITKKILSIFNKNSVSEERIIIEGHEPDKKIFLESYNKIDIALDPFPYSGCSTSFECAFMGVPILTLEGDNFLSRCGVSINANLDMNEWTAKDKIDYYEKACKFSQNIKDLNFIRKNLHTKAINSSLFDSKNFSKDFAQIMISLVKNR